MTATDSTILDALTVAGEGVRRCTDERNRLIAAAAAAGMSRRQIAAAVGLSAAAVQQIIRRVEGSP